MEQVLTATLITRLLVDRGGHHAPVQKMRQERAFSKNGRGYRFVPFLHEGFAQEGKILTEKIIEAKNKAAVAKDPEEITKLCRSVEYYGNELLALHKAYNLGPSQELVDLIETHKKMREEAEK